MISSKEELKLYLKIDNMMNRGSFKRTLHQRIREFIYPDYIMSYLRCLRKDEYYRGTHHNGLLKKINSIRFYRLGFKCGFSIAPGVCGYGLVIPHYGTIVVGGGNTIGNYAVLHTSICITAGKKHIGNALYLSTGGKIVHDVQLGDNISVGANSLVNKTQIEGECLLAGVPAVRIKDSIPWYIRDGDEYTQRIDECEKLRSILMAEK